MKKIFIIIPFLFVFGHSTYAQQRKSHYLIVAIYQELGIGGRSRLIETREDGTQQQKDIQLKNPYTLARVRENEDSLFRLLNPYFEDGWELVTAVSPVIPVAPQSTILVTRYFLRKEKL